MKQLWKFLKTPMTTHIGNLFTKLSLLSSSTKTFSLVGVIILVIALPITVIVLQKQTNIFQHAASTNLPAVYYECHQLSGDSSTPRNGIDKYTNPNPSQGSTFVNYQYCQWNQYCSPLSHIVTNPAALCVNITGCRCNSGQVGVLGGGFNCNGGVVSRVCGSYLYCNDTAPKEAGLWPCSTTKPAPPPPPPSCSSLGGTCSYSSCAAGTLNGTCGSSYMSCCKPNEGPNNVCSVQAGSTTNTWVCNSHDGNLYLCKGTAYQNQKTSCPSGCHVNSGTNANDACNQGGDPNWYQCDSFAPHSSTPNNGIDQVSDQAATYIYQRNITYCASNQWCDADKPTTHVTSSLCVNITNCACNSGQSGKAGGSFSCNNGNVQRSCGSNVYCNTNAVGGIQGIWPCSYSRPSDICFGATQGNGWYCGGANGAQGDKNTVYHCVNNTEVTADRQSCGSVGCFVNPGGADSCNTQGGGNPSPTSGSGGGNPSPTSGGGGGNPSPTSGGGGNPSPTSGSGGGNPSPTSGGNKQDTKIALTINLTSIGTGDFDNKNPRHTSRTGNVRVYDAADPSKNIQSSSQTLNFNSGKGNFASNSIDLGSSLSSTATYKVEVKIPGYLPATADVTYGDTSQVIDITPIGGDINQVDSNGIIIGDGKVDINDYSIFRQCRNVDANTTISFQSNAKTVNVKCGDLINFFDFQDGGTMESVLFTPSGGTSVGEWDANYNLWLRWYLQANSFQ